MVRTDKRHLTITSIINFGLILKLITITWEGNDKAITLVIFGYLALTIANGVIWMVLKILNRSESRIYRIVTIGLIILFIPTVIVSTVY